MKRVPLQIFGWGFGVPELVEWPDCHGVAVGLNDHRKHQQVLTAIMQGLPTGYTQIARVRDEECTAIRGSTKLCFVIGTNKTPRNLDQAQDMERIDQFRRVLGSRAPLKWHRYAGRV